MKNKLKKEDLNMNGSVPVYSAETTNNGIIGYTNQKAEYIVDQKNQFYVVFGDHTISFNIATNDFCVADNVKVLSVNNFIKINHLFFITAAWKKCLNYKGYSRHWSDAKNIKFKLPIKNKKIDFDFMEAFIAEIEAEHIAELEAEKIAKLDAYLKVTGLEDYELTKAEENALNDFKNENIKWSKFKIGDLFKINTGSLLSTINLEKGLIPRISAKSGNNGILGYFSTETIPAARHFENFISVNFFGSKGGIFYHPYKASVEMKVHILKISNIDLNKATGIFISSVLKESLNGFSYGNQLSSSKLKEESFYINLPLKNNLIDYQFMEIFIKAIEKLVIKDVVLYTNKKIEATKKVVNKNI